MLVAIFPAMPTSSNLDLSIVEHVDELPDGCPSARLPFRIELGVHVRNHCVCRKKSDPHVWFVHLLMHHCYRNAVHFPEVTQ